MKEIWQYKCNARTYESIIKNNRDFVIIYRDSFKEALQNEIAELECDIETSKFEFKVYCKLNSDLLLEQEKTILQRSKICLEHRWYTYKLNKLSKRITKLGKIHRRYLAIKIRFNQIAFLTK